MPNVFVAMPTHNGWCRTGAALGWLWYPFDQRRGLGRRPIPAGGMDSLLAHGFNGLLCDALNSAKMRNLPADYFAMLHADIAPCRFWLDILLDEMERLDADVVSAVVPIKSDAGVSSTAIDFAEGGYVKRLTMKEIASLPETFCQADTEYPDRRLLFNTGCWVANLRKPWLSSWLAAKAGPPGFCINDTISQDKEGVWSSQVEPEDWRFSRQMAALGAKCYVTKKVSLGHFGEREYRNDEVWGEAVDSEAAGIAAKVR